MIAAERGHELIEERIQCILRGDVGTSFAQGVQGFALKPDGHIRRTLKLDVVSEYYVYSWILRNHKRIEGKALEGRERFGYRLASGRPLPIHQAHRGFFRRRQLLEDEYPEQVRCDISHYFASIYHHDICAWLETLSLAEPSDGDGLGRLLREVNTGRSVGCLPAGLYPMKMIGSAWLSFIDSSREIDCDVILRFMDDFVLLSKDRDKVRRAFMALQGLLGRKSLDLNSAKSWFSWEDGEEPDFGIESSVPDLRFDSIDFSGDSDVSEAPDPKARPKLAWRQVEQMKEIFAEDRLSTKGAALVLRRLVEHDAVSNEELVSSIERLPSAAKHIYYAIGLCRQKEDLADQLLAFLQGQDSLHPYQVFWLACACDDFLSQVFNIDALALELLRLASEDQLASAKVLELKSAEGLNEMRVELLKTGESSFRSWCAAVGAVGVPASQRNHVLKYFGKSSWTNHLVHQCLRQS